MRNSANCLTLPVLAQSSSLQHINCFEEEEPTLAANVVRSSCGGKQNYLPIDNHLVTIHEDQLVRKRYDAMKLRARVVVVGVGVGVCVWVGVGVGGGGLLVVGGGVDETTKRKIF